MSQRQVVPLAGTVHCCRGPASDRPHHVPAARASRAHAATRTPPPNPLHPQPVLCGRPGHVRVPRLARGAQGRVRGRQERAQQDPGGGLEVWVPHRWCCGCCCHGAPAAASHCTGLAHCADMPDWCWLVPGGWGLATRISLSCTSCTCPVTGAACCPQTTVTWPCLTGCRPWRVRAPADAVCHTQCVCVLP
jgi:hypothetical protein